MFHKLNWLPVANKSKVPRMCHVYSIQICSKQMPSLYEVFRPAENMRINTRNSFFKPNYPFRKTSTGQKGLSYIGPAIWNKIPEIIKKTTNLNTFKHKMEYYYLNDPLIQIYEMWVDLVMLWLS